MKKKSLALIMAIVMVFGATVGATFALLMDSTDSVVNTFTLGGVEISLTESEEDWSKQLVPGNSYAKIQLLLLKMKQT